MNPPQPLYVGFGMLTPVAIMVVEQLPEHNTGALVKEVSEFVFDDAAIVACLLRQWDLPTAMIGTAVGDDPRGHLLADQLTELKESGPDVLPAYTRNVKLALFEQASQVFLEVKP